MCVFIGFFFFHFNSVRVEENKTPADVKIKQSTDDASPTVQPIKPGKYTSPRKHPFRWSSRSRPSHKKMVLMHTQSASGGDASHYLTGKEDNSTYQSSGSLQQQQQQQQSTPVKSILNTNNGNNYNVITPIYSSPIISSTASSGLHQPTLSSRMVNNAEIILHDSKSEYDEAAEYTSFWSLSVGQLTILRKLALIQLASLAEKHCSINRSPFSW
ncbi:unnamed protein product [Trichobilharzia regenti]|nr:unnamed protein product [Trichobilharzia regenti]